jgi:hypothetical protein
LTAVFFVSRRQTGGCPIARSVGGVELADRPGGIEHEHAAHRISLFWQRFFQLVQKSLVTFGLMAALYLSAKIKESTYSSKTTALPGSHNS